MSLQDQLGLIHPAIATLVVFPLIGIVLHFALKTRQRRLANLQGEKSKIASTVGIEHVQIGRYLSNAVVGVTLLGIAHPMVWKMQAAGAWQKEQGRVLFIGAMFLAAIASLVCLNVARSQLWRGLWATLTGVALWIVGSQPEIFKREFEWAVSHYYYGMIAAMLMIFSLAIVPEIYKSLTWRRVHIALNIVALLFFIGQGFTGARDLLEIPVSWQKPYVEQLYQQQCDKQPCTIQKAP
jgi:hypothetical protein